MTQQTSVWSYRELEASGRLNELELQVVKFMEENPGELSGADIARGCIVANDGLGEFDSYRNRLAPLARMGVVYERGKKQDPYTKKTVITWALTKRMPKPLTKLSRADQLQVNAFKALLKVMKSTAGMKAIVAAQGFYREVMSDAAKKAYNESKR